MTNGRKGVDKFLESWARAERTGDVATLDGLLTDDFVGVGPLGFVLPKQAWLERHAANGLKYEGFELDETQVHEHGDAVLVTARLNQPGTFQGNPIPSATRATMLLVDDSDRKQLAGISLTFVAGTPGAPPMPGPPAS